MDADRTYCRSGRHLLAVTGRTPDGRCQECRRASWRAYQRSSKGHAAARRYEDSRYGRETRSRYATGGRYVVDSAAGAERLAEYGIVLEQGSDSPETPLRQYQALSAEQLEHLRQNFPDRLPDVLLQDRWTREHEQIRVNGFRVWQRREIAIPEPAHIADFRQKWNQTAL